MLDCVSIPDLPLFVTFSKSRYLVKPRHSKMCVRTNVPQKMFFFFFVYITSHLYSMVEKERKNVLEVRNHTDRVVSFLIRLLKRKKLLRFVPKAVRTQSIGFIHSASRFP